MEILMPQLGETVAEGKITAWHRAVGDSVSPGEILFEIETDKTAMEVPTTVAGVLSEIFVTAGATVPVGSVVAILSENSTLQPTPEPKTVAPSAAGSRDPFDAVHSPERNFGPAVLTNGVIVTPAARRLATQMNTDLNNIVGTGPKGRIVAKDVINAASGAIPTAVAPNTPGAVAERASAERIKMQFAGVPFDEIMLDGMRRTIARRLLEAKQTIPHFYLTSDVNIERLMAVRSEVNAHVDGRAKLSINDFIIKALAMALQKVPAANSAWAEDRILRFKHSDVGVAVTVDGGIFAPVIRRAESKPITDISNEMKALVERARAKTLKPSESQGGSIAISNLGMFGVRSFSAIINPPQAAILAVGIAERRPSEGPDGTVRFSSALTVTLSCDHRVIDGVLGAQLLAAFKERCESPSSLLL
jgi:pyruvate dehydrogenase E2 component (dihydrolipoamide acetyltransferase)